ncbi:MAG: class I SAM-dependent methyltransferase [Ktedonobacterales bacterium]|nr:class I SAM-dependent methyltransferase [Ktedonobacterales bacterium]
MTTDEERGQYPALTDATRAIWNQNAAFWDEAMGEGNSFQRVLVGPTTERLLAPRAGEEVLELACGNGAMARRLARLGVRVLATDFSERFVERARTNSAEYADHLEYRVVDATDEAQLLALGEGRFDAALCDMAIMDMATIEPMLAAVRRLLKPDGRFVFSLAHPCFNSGRFTLVVEEEDREGELVATYSVKITRYLEPIVTRGLGIAGQPTPHYYFHRPLSLLFGACFRAGFVLDALEEPAFDMPVETTRTLSWQNFTGLPPMLAARLRAP